MELDPYKVLKVDPSADIEIINAAYKALSKKYHPDLNKSPDAVPRMQEINRAYDMLKDPAERAKVDAQLAKARVSQSNYAPPNPSRPSNPTPGSYGSRYNPPPPPSNPRASGSNPFNDVGERARDVGEKARKVWDNITRPTEPDPNGYYLFSKRLVDEAQNKVLRIAVYLDRDNAKVCNIYASAPDDKGRIQTGSAFLKALELYDLVEAVGEAVAAMTAPNTPIEMNTGHDTYYKRKINGLGSTFVGLEVIKYTRGTGKVCLLSVGERRGTIEGVASPQTEKQLIQVQRYLEEALRHVR